jgi:hypothetical protein
MILDFNILRTSMNNTGVNDRMKNPQWLFAFAIYNSKHTRGEWLSVDVQTAYTKVLAYLMNNQITHL